MCEPLDESRSTRPNPPAIGTDEMSGELAGHATAVIRKWSRGGFRIGNTPRSIAGWNPSGDTFEESETLTNRMILRMRRAVLYGVVIVCLCLLFSLNGPSAQRMVNGAGGSSSGTTAVAVSVAN